MAQVVILAAGSGQRLLPLTSEIPKALLKLGSETLLEYQIRTLVQLGIPAGNIGIVTGHLPDLIEEVASRLHCHTVFNPHYQRANNTVSLFSFLQWTKSHRKAVQQIVIVNCDTLAHPDIFRKLLQTPMENAVSVDMSRGRIEEAMKVSVENEVVRKFSKSLSGRSSHGEYIGLAKFSSQGLEALFEALQEMIKNEKINEWYEEAFNLIACSIPIYAISIQGLPWVEIDTTEDYHQAQLLYEERLV
jgi:choline kinase